MLTGMSEQVATPYGFLSYAAVDLAPPLTIADRLEVALAVERTVLT